MRSQSARPWPRRAMRGTEPLPSVLTLSVAAILAASLAGCATSNQQQSYAGAYSGRHAAVPAPMPKSRVEIEDDGQPVQAPPARKMRPEEDDPNEPWSKNYGGPNGRAPKIADFAPAPAPRVAVSTPAPMPPMAPAAATSTRRAAVSSPQPPAATLAGFNPDAILAQAVAAHEIRQQTR